MHYQVDHVEPECRPKITRKAVDKKDPRSLHLNQEDAMVQ